MALEDSQVSFRYKDYTHGHRLRTLTLDAVEFLRRLMLHVPPRGFHRLRHFGFLANRVRQEKLVQCRTLLGHVTPPHPRAVAVDLKTPEGSAGEPGAVCPVCQHGRMQLVQTFEFITIKPSVATGAGAPGNCAERNRAPSLHHGYLFSKDECGL